MRISEVNIVLIKPHNGLIGFASLVINEEIYLSGIGIHQKLGGTGYRLTYPTRKNGNQNFDIFHPITNGAGKALEEEIVTKLNDVMKKRANDVRHNSSESTRTYVCD